MMAITRAASICRPASISLSSSASFSRRPILSGAAQLRMTMKITNVTPLVLGTPWRNLTFVKVETDEGIYGLGEVRMNNRTNALLGYLTEAVPRYAIGLDPFDTE